MPTLSRINVFPIKSLDGTAVPEAPLLSSGPLQWDRRLAILDQDGNLLTAKRSPRVHLLASVFDLSRETVALGRRGESLSSPISLHDHAALADWLSTFFGQPVRIVEDTVRAMPDDLDAPGPTVISSATLRAVADWFHLSFDEVRRRFRANLEVDGTAPFWEDRLYGPVPGDEVRFQIGEAEFLGVNPCQRCPVPSRSPDTGKADATFARTFAERRAAELPAWAPRGRFDHFYRLATNTRPAHWTRPLKLRVGDDVRILD